MCLYGDVETCLLHEKAVSLSARNVLTSHCSLQILPFAVTNAHIMSFAYTYLHYPGEELVEEKQLALKCLEEQDSK